MAHFAKIDENNRVVNVTVVNNVELIDSTGKESEAKGIAFCQSLFGGNWVQTSYNSNFRVRYAGVGFTYDAQRDAFIPPQTYPSWVLDPVTLDWVAPVPYPQDGKNYWWDEATRSWVEVTPNT